MHGRVKVRTSEEQAQAKRQEQKEKLQIYQSVTGKIFSKRANEEYDEESLVLTARLLEKNPDFYTLWNYRREVLMKLKLSKNQEELKKLCLEELDLTQNCLRVNPKSYGTWHHRYWTMDFNPEGDWRRELKLCNYFLSLDERNFHCWDYRRLVAKKCNVSHQEELDYSTSLIEANFSNYSAWHYRSTLLPAVHYDKDTKNVKEDILLKEFELIQNAAFTDPDDQSVWFYHRWLLGRNKTPLQILCVSFFKSENSVAALISEPVESNDLVMKFNDKAVPVSWSSVDGSLTSTVWKCHLPHSVSEEVFQSGDTKCSITVGIPLHENEWKDGWTFYRMLHCEINGSESFVWRNSSRADTFRSDFSAATKDVLERELESCLQLNELEPNCKWTLFTCVLLMRALNNHKYQSDIEGHLQKLMEVDSSRKNYYKDLSSKFIIEDFIENSPAQTVDIDLSSHKLSSLQHFDQFFLIEQINLASNNLTSVYPLRFLICVKRVILDDNQLSTLEGMEELQGLEYLSVKRNYLKKIKCFEVLQKCKNLQELFVEGNPVTAEPELLLSLKMLTALRLLDGSGL